MLVRNYSILCEIRTKEGNELPTGAELQDEMRYRGRLHDANMELVTRHSLNMVIASLNGHIAGLVDLMEIEGSRLCEGCNSPDRIERALWNGIDIERRKRIEVYQREIKFSLDVKRELSTMLGGSGRQS